MNRSDLIPYRIIDAEECIRQVSRWRLAGSKIAFTNGVFDILHPGHIFSLSQAAKEADYLVVGLNSDSSVKRLKGPDRPVNDEKARALILASLMIVDAVVIFTENTPLELIKKIRPDVLVKGGDYRIDEIVGAPEVQSGGGRVVINPLLEGWSTTRLIESLKAKP